MELTGEDTAASGSSEKGNTVLRPQALPAIGWVLGEKVRVGKVGEALPDPRRCRLRTDPVPSDLRHPDTFWKASRATGQNAQPRVAGRLLAPFRQQLQTETDGQGRPPRFETLAKGDDSGPGVRESQVMGFGDTSSTIISRRESFDRLLRRVGELRASDQEFVRLYLVFAGNMRAIAASLGITQANARMRWVRLRRKLGDDDDDEQSGAA